MKNKEFVKVNSIDRIELGLIIRMGKGELVYYLLKVK